MSASGAAAAANVTSQGADKGRPGPPSAVQAIVTAGLLAGILDITAAFTQSGIAGVTPDRVLRYVASGVLGPSAFQGGAGTAALGALLHFVIAMGAATVYYAASRKLGILVRQAVLSGVLYGIAVYFFMSRIVVPLSAVPPRPRVVNPTQVVIHMFCVGLPIALMVRRHSK